MKYPKKAVYTVEYWDCGDPDHKHKAERAAANCAESRQKRQDLQEQGRPGKKWHDMALRNILSMYRSGKTKHDLAKSLNLSWATVHNVIQRAERREADGYSCGNYEVDVLSVRTANVLKQNGLFTRSEVEAALEKGALNDLYNIGSATKIEIAAWIRAN